MGTKKWSEIKKLSKATDADRAEACAELEEEMRSYSLAELCRHLSITQEDLSAALNVNQPAVSKLERADDVSLSRLRNAVEALGVELGVGVRIAGVRFPLHLLERSRPKALTNGEILDQQHELTHRCEEFDSRSVGFVPFAHRWLRLRVPSSLLSKRTAPTVVSNSTFAQG